MRTTVSIDDAVLQEAERLTGVSQRSRLVREAFKALIAREKAVRLAKLGGSEKELRPISRRRTS